jgi:carbon storage regulator CsrA
VVEVVRVNGDKVRLGIECDKSISIHRKEVFDAIKRHAELSEFDALGDDEDGCGPDGNYVDQ